MRYPSAKTISLRQEVAGCALNGGLLNINVTGGADRRADRSSDSAIPEQQARMACGNN